MEMELETLLHITVFENVKLSDLSQFLERTPYAVHKYKPGEYVAMRGEPCRSVYFLLEGKIRSGMIGSDGKEVTIELLNGPNMLAPAFIYASDNQFPVNVECVTPCEVCILDKERFMNLMQLNPTVLSNFLRVISDRSIFLSQKVNTFALQNLKGRLALYLLNTQDIDTQQQIAERLGVARPSVARILAELVNEGCLQIDRHQIKIIDAHKLAKYL